MAEKPKLKESDEILSSIDGKRRRRQPQPALLQSDALPPPIVRAEPDDSPDADSTGSRRRTTKKTESQPPEQDSHPLDMSKYELPKQQKRRGRPRKDTADSEAVPASYTPPPEPKPKAEPKAKPDSAPAQIIEPEPPEIRPAASGRKKSASQGKAKPAAETLAQPAILRGQKADAKDVKEFAFEDLDERHRLEQRQKAAEEAEKAKQEAQAVRRKVEEARLRAEKAAELAQKEEREAAELARRQAEIEEEAARREAEAEDILRKSDEETRRKLAEDVDYQDNVMTRLGSAFEEQFSQRFEGEQPEEKPWWLAERRSGLGKPEPEPAPKPTPPPSASDRKKAAPAKMNPPPSPPPPQPSTEAAAPEQEDSDADDFLRMFEQEINSEEDDRDQSFRETLAEKFMRERERYLRELGIADQMEAERLERESLEKARLEEELAREQAAPPRRKLDFQIRPEMHAPSGEAPAQPQRQAQAKPAFQSPPAAPLIYGPNAKAQIQLPVEPEPPENDMPPLPEQQPGKKSAEQLLLELGELNKSMKTRKSNADKPPQFNFRFKPMKEKKSAEHVLESRPQKRPLATRIVILTACVGLLVLSLMAWAIAAAFGPFGSLGQIQLPGESTGDGMTDEVYTAYQNYHPEAMRSYSDVVVKRSGIQLSNLDVRDKLVIDEEAAVEGSLTLENVSVGGYIYVNSSGVNLLELRNVQARRIVVTNENHIVAIRTHGSTDVEEVELRTSGAVSLGEMDSEAPGVRSVTVRNSSDSGEVLTLDVYGSALGSLTTEGEASITFDGATADVMSANGSFSLIGTGRIGSLSAGYGAGQGAISHDAPVAYPMSILVKGVDIGHLNLKSSATVNLSSVVDSAVAEDSMILGGNGTIGSLVFNEKFGNSRLAVDISGLTVQQLITNAEALIYSSGSSIINTLTANQSTYALGNKVNHLVANAPGVIYENKPDRQTVAAGISAPQSKADNPNLDYSSGSAAMPVTDPGGDAVSATCAHSADDGGFTQGDGSKDNPYVIESPAQLAHVAQHLTSHFIQTDNIDIAADSGFAAGFPVIGGGGRRFSGVYDGGGFSIRNLRINGDSESVGLFAENTGIIRDLHIVSGEISAGSRSFAGAVAGMNYQGGVIESCSNGANLNASGSAYAGGIAGYNYGGKLRDCYNTGRITGGDASGGIAGMNRQSGSVTGCYNVGVIDGAGDIGSVAGSNESVVTNCYYLEYGELEGVGSGDGNVLARTDDQLSSSMMAAELAAGNDSSKWQSGDPAIYPYPVLRRPENVDSVSGLGGASGEDDELSEEDELEEYEDGEEENLLG